MKHALNLAVITLCSPFAPAAPAADIVAIAWPWGTYRIDPATGDGESVGSPGNPQLNSLARDLNGDFFSVDTDGNLVQLDPATGAATVVTALDFGGSAPTVPALAFSPAGTLFAISREFPDTLYTVNRGTGEGTLVGPLGGFTVQGLAFSPAGVLFGWDIGSGLVTINVATGAATDVNPDEGATASLQCLAFSPEGVLYGAQYGLFTIDPATGVSTAVGGGNLFDIRGMDFNTGPAFRLTITAVEAGLKICCSTSEGQTYRIQRRNGFEPEFDWENLGNPFAGTGGEICVTNQAAFPRRFFRAVTQLPAN